MATKNLQVLICDENQDSRDILKEAILSCDKSAHFLEALDGSQATMKASMQKFDLVVVDTDLKKRNATDFINNLKNQSASTRPQWILVISSRAEDPGIKSLIGDLPILAKPFSIGVVKQEIRKIFESSGKKIAATLDVSFINPFIDAAIEVLKVTGGTEIKKERVFVRKDDQISGDISALIALNSNSYSGSMAISFEEKCFLEVVSKMLGTQQTEIIPKNADAAGELCNQIFGVAKRVLNDSGHTIKMAIPSVVRGKNHSIQHLNNGTVIAVQFSCSAGKFNIETCVKENS